MAGVLLVTSKSDSLGNRCILDQLGGHAGLCISSNLSDSQRSGVCEGSQLPGDPSCSVVAEKVVVLNAPLVVHSQASGSARPQGFARTARLLCVTPKSWVVLVDRTQPCKRHFGAG